MNADKLWLAPIRKGRKVRLVSEREDLKGQQGEVLSRNGIEYAVKLKDGRIVHVNDTQVEEA